MTTFNKTLYYKTLGQYISFTYLQTWSTVPIRYQY